MNRFVIFLLRIGTEVGASTVSWKLVNWIASKLYNQFLSNIICAGWLMFCAKDRVWHVSPRTPVRLYVPTHPTLSPHLTPYRIHLRGIFWTIVPFPTTINRYNIWVGLVTEILSAVFAVFAAHFALKYLFSSQLADVIGHAILLTAFSDRAFELNPPPVPLASVNPLTCNLINLTSSHSTTNSTEGIMWKLIGFGLEKGAEKLLVYATTPAKRRRRSPRTTTELVPFPNTFPADILREILDATLHQIWEETDKERDPEFSDVVSLMLTCKDFKAWTFPQFYSYIHLANPTRVSQLAECFASTINNGDGDGGRYLWDIPPGQERVDVYRERAPRVHALSLVDFTWTLDEHLDDSVTLSVMLPHLRRLNIHWSLLNQFRRRPTAFHAAQITIVMDENPPDNIALIAAHNTRLVLVHQDIGIRFAYPLDASGKVPLTHRRVCASVDSTFMSHSSTKRLAIECYLEDEVDAEETERSKNALQKFLRLADKYASLKKLTRIVFIVWVGDEEYENWVDPQPDGEITASEMAIHGTIDRYKAIVGSQVCTHGMEFLFSCPDEKRPRTPKGSLVLYHCVRENFYNGVSLSWKGTG